MEILLIEDNLSIVKGLEYLFKQENYNLNIATNLKEATQIIMERKISLIILDITLPDGNGLKFYENIVRKNNIPTIFLTAQDDEETIVEALNMGADDYITKPFSVRELMAKIKANLRKLEQKTDIPTIEDDTEKETEQTINIGNLVLDLEKIEARIDGKSIDITLKEFEFLKYLALKHGQAVTREELLKNVWEYDYIGDERTVDVLVRRLRKKIKDDTTSPKILATKRGIGYYLKTDYPDKQRKD